MLSVSKSRKCITLLSLFLLSACASGPSVQKYTYPSGANPKIELGLLEQQMRNAQANNVDVLSPELYVNAENKLNDARAEWSSNGKTEDIMNDLGWSKAYLDQAMTNSSNVQRDLSDVLKSRSKAVQANAPNLVPKQFANAETELRSHAKDYEKGNTALSVDDRNQLNLNYRNAELSAIKANRLGTIYRDIQRAKEMDAEKLAPKTLAEAESNYKAAVLAIEADRYNLKTIDPAVVAAKNSSDKLLEITEIAKKSKDAPTEAVAIEIARRNHMIEESNAQLQETNQELKTQTRFEQTLEKAQKKFPANEADVYRVGDNLLIRLKEMNFATGSAVIPKASYDSLTKVKQVIAATGATAVLVEGHTDTVGTKQTNMDLSKKRAESVANYLVKDTALTKDEVTAKGYGYSKPLAPNNTKQDRAENRRVDILITPSAKQ